MDGEEYHVCKNKSRYQTLAAELDKKYFCVMLGFAVMVYFPLISLKLTNTVDGLWTTAEYMAEHGSFPTDDGSGW